MGWSSRGCRVALASPKSATSPPCLFSKQGTEGGQGGQGTEGVEGGQGGEEGQRLEGGEGGEVGYGDGYESLPPRDKSQKLWGTRSAPGVLAAAGTTPGAGGSFSGTRANRGDGGGDDGGGYDARLAGTGRTDSAPQDSGLSRNLRGRPPGSDSGQGRLSPAGQRTGMGMGAGTGGEYTHQQPPGGGVDANSRFPGAQCELSSHTFRRILQLSKRGGSKSKSPTNLLPFHSGGRPNSIDVSGHTSSSPIQSPQLLGTTDFSPNFSRGTGAAAVKSWTRGGGKKFSPNGVRGGAGGSPDARVSDLWSMG